MAAAEQAYPSTVVQLRSFVFQRAVGCLARLSFLPFGLMNKSLPPDPPFTDGMLGLKYAWHASIR